MKKVTSTFILALLSILFSCNNNIGEDNIPTKYKPLFKELDMQVLVDANKVIIVTDSLLYKSDAISYDNYTLVKIYQLRQQAFSNLKKMDSVLYAGEKIRTIASQIPDSLAIAKSLLLAKGDIEFKEQKKLLVYIPSAIQTFSKNKMPFEEARLHANYGAILVQSGDFKLAQSHLLTAYDMMEKLDSIKQLTNISTYIGNNYQRLKSNDLAIKYYYKALQLARQTNDSLTQVSILMNLGIFYSHVDGKTDSTIIYYQQAKKLYPINGTYYLGMKLDYNMATESFRRKKYTEAQAIFNDMIVKCQQQNLTEGLAHAYTGLSNVYAESNQLPLAIQSSKKAFWLFDSLGLKYDAHAEAENLVGIYAKSGNSQEAIKAMNIAKKLNDSIMSVEKQSAVLEIESKYQADKKEQEIILLKKNASYRQNIIIILIVVALVFFILYRKLKQTNHDLNISQQVLVERYRKEKELRDAEREDDRAKIESLHAKANIVGIANTENESSTMDLLTQYFNDAKPYLDPKLKQEDILLKTHISAKALLKLLKEHGFDNFNAFLNSYRVNEAKMLIEMPENNNLKIEVIATKAGFGTRQSFYNAFETNTGLSPAYYRSKMMEVSA